MAVVLIAAAAVLAVIHILVQVLDVAVGGWKYCLLIGLGVGTVSTVWRMTAPKTSAAGNSN